ncbi:MAG: hypothetical protein M3Z09_03740 [Acidobacteriota bacterium]|nr:hypothetical protein [Acidobacteriota bacterium]
MEFGRHADLVARKGLYYAMWRQQAGEESARTGKGPEQKVLALQTKV